MKKRLICLIIASILIDVFAVKAYSLNVQLATPNIGPTGTLNLFGSRPQEKKHFSFGFVTDYTQAPLEFRNFTTGRQVRAIVNYLVTTDFLAEVGLMRRLTMGVDFPINGGNHMVLNDPAQDKRFFSLGDVSVYAKYAILHPDDFPVGLSIMPFVIAPSGSLDNFTGDRGTDLGAKILFDKEFKGGYIGTNLGIKGRFKSEIITATGSTARLDVGSEFLYGIGGGIDVVKNRLQLMAEFIGSTVVTDFAKHENSSPMQINGGLKALFLDKQLNLYAGGGAGLNGGYGAPQYRVLGGLSANFPKPAEAVYKVKERIETIVLQGVHFFTNSAELTPDSKKILDEDYVELKKYPDVKFVVVGHTDSRAGEEYNQKLSERRARSVMDYFVKKGIPANLITSVGKGKTEPIVPNDSPDHMEQNRRVELMIIHAPEQNPVNL